MLSLSFILALLALIGWFYLASFNGGFWRPLIEDRQASSPAHAPKIWPSVAIIVPARNEADILHACLPSLLKQDYPGSWQLLLVDDHSSDGTSDVARSLATRNNAEQRLQIVNAPDLAEGWRGKVAAQNAGVVASNSDYILFTDADITHPADALRRLVTRAENRGLDLCSLMVRLHCATLAEKLLVPAFVFFFAMLYPFRRANNIDSNIAAAAGGVMLVKRAALDRAGGMKAIKGALIDDCSLAKLIKTRGGEFSQPGRTELTLAIDTLSARPYPEIRDVWDMIARSAFTQLRYSGLLLAGCVLGMSLLFMVPPLLPLFAGLYATGLALFVWLVMSALYRPMVKFYDLPLIWTLTLPVAGAIYIAATIDSARLYWQGKGGQWKGRAQA